MRYLVQFLVPLAIFVVVAMLATRKRRAAQYANNSKPGGFGMFTTILAIGAVTAVAIAWLTHSLWEI